MAKQDRRRGTRPKARPREAGRLGGEARSVQVYRPTTAARHEEAAAHRAESRQGAERSLSGAEIWNIAKQTFVEFGQDKGTLMAASVAFYVLISLVPLVVVGVAIFGFVMTDDQARSAVMSFAGRYLPGQEEMLRSSIDAVRSSRGTIGLVGLATLLFTAGSGFATLETAINTIWRVENRSFLMNKLYALGMTLGIGLLLILSLSVGVLMSWAEVIPGLGWLAGNIPGQILAALLTVFLSGLMFSAIYKFLPNVEVGWRPALIGGFVTAVLWEAFKQAYNWYTSSSFQGDQAATYGALAGFVGLLMWIYYSSVLVLLGAELAWVLTGCPEGEAEAGAA